MVSSFTSAPRSGFYYFAQGWKARLATWDSAFRYFTAAGQYFVDGGRILVALYATRCLDPDAHELCSDWLQWLSYLLWPWLSSLCC